MRWLGLVRRSEEAYVGWIRRFILANNKRHPREMGAAEVEAFLTALAVRDKVSASTQNQALSALLFLYKQVLGVDLPWMSDIPLVINDWSVLQKLDQTQQNAVWTALWRGLDCPWTGNCSETSLPVSALCNSPNFQRDAGADYYSIVRRSLSPAQFDALMMLMSGVNNYRRQHGG